MKCANNSLLRRLRRDLMAASGDRQTIGCGTRLFRYLREVEARQQARIDRDLEQLRPIMFEHERRTPPDLAGLWRRGKL